MAALLSKLSEPSGKALNFMNTVWNIGNPGNLWTFTLKVLSYCNYYKCTTTKWTVEPTACLLKLNKWHHWCNQTNQLLKYLYSTVLNLNKFHFPSTLVKLNPLHWLQTDQTLWHIHCDIYVAHAAKKIGLFDTRNYHSSTHTIQFCYVCVRWWNRAKTLVWTETVFVLKHCFKMEKY